MAGNGRYKTNVEQFSTVLDYAGVVESAGVVDMLSNFLNCFPNIMFCCRRLSECDDLKLIISTLMNNRSMKCPMSNDSCQIIYRKYLESELEEYSELIEGFHTAIHTNPPNKCK